ncbi:MAG: hypothetical protein NZV14_18270 [Bryobacteraceae bacterium]|nr:hypothetical protein [Bryobacteraceae bacterium]MDW8380112.1 hypothetical protein [Bryobacterales bacterium]
MPLLLVFAFALLFTACAPRPAPSEANPKPAITVAQRPEADDVGRYLAGLPVREDSAFRELVSVPAWQDHKREFDALWRKFDRERRPKLEQFQRSELALVELQPPTLFYPFGGPDILTATIFFPQARTYVLVGLEPPGSLPTKESIAKREAQDYFPRIRRTIFSLLYRSFFVTEAMDKQLRGQITDGVLPLLLIELVRAGYTVLGYQHVRLSSEGQLLAEEAARSTSASGQNRGVVIEFRGDHSAVAQQLVYLSLNLHDSAFKTNAAFRTFMSLQAPVATFFKAASYLPHQKGFALLRDYVLEISSGILQDDTGIPFRYWDSEKWEIQLYGKYTQPYGSFRYMVQPDLRKAYELGQAQVKPLGFYIGYGFGRAPSALIRARKKSPGQKQGVAPHMK